MDVKKYLKDSYSKQFEIYYGRKPTQEQLNVYESFFLRKTDDAKKVGEVCQIPFDEKFSSRDVFRRNFKVIFDFEPSSEQLDVFISYRLGVISDLAVIWEVNKAKKNKEEAQREPLSE